MQKATAGGWRRIAPLRSKTSERSTPATRFHRRSVDSARRLTVRVSSFPAALHRRASVDVLGALRRALHAGSASERAVPLAAALIVLVASFVSFAPTGSRGSVDGTGDVVRIAAGGDGAGIVEGSAYDEIEVAGILGRNKGSDTESQEVAAVAVGPILEDGTLFKPIVVDTTVADARSLMRIHTVLAGDTLTGIASQYDVSMMTLWWANKLASKTDLHVGQKIVVPPTTGLVATVTEGQTVEGLAAQYKIDAESIIDVNQLEDTNLVIGQVLMLPGAAGAGIPTPKPTSSGRSGSSSGSGGSYTGGSFRWPLVGSSYYISQYYHYGHEAIDIATSSGTTVVAATGGTVVWAGWRSNGGGYQVWLSHGGNVYTGYYHLSSISVASGQWVGRGSQVGRVGCSGRCTGPHLHFAVSIGPMDSGRRVNPLRYY